MTTTLVDSPMEVPDCCPGCGKRLERERFPEDRECGIMAAYDAWDCADCELGFEWAVRKWSNDND